MLQELLRRPEEDGAADRLPAAALLDQPPVDERGHGAVALHAADLLDLHARDGLAVGHHRQRLQRGLGERLPAHGLEHLLQDLAVLRPGAELQALLVAHQADAPPLAVAQGEAAQHRLELLRRDLQRLQERVDAHRLPRGKEHGLRGRNLLLQRHASSPFPSAITMGA